MVGIERQIKVETHGHYRVLETEGERGLLVGFHGYGETAAVHLEALGKIPGVGQWTLCAVQGPSVFYRQSTGGVVASWMTKFQRELAIQDNIAFVARVVERLHQERGEHLPLVFAGFSQGVAMAYRSAAFAGQKSQGLIALAGDVPPDLEPAAVRTLPRILLGRGDRDKWYDESKMNADLTRLQGAGVEVEARVFSGGHEWAQPFLETCGEFLRSVG